MGPLNKFFHKGGWWAIVIIFVITVSFYFKFNKLWLISVPYIIFCMHNIGKLNVLKLHIYGEKVYRKNLNSKCGINFIRCEDYTFHMWDDLDGHRIYVERDSNNKKYLVSNEKYESSELICENCLKEK
jgi:hypothetical protein